MDLDLLEGFSDDDGEGEGNQKSGSKKNPRPLFFDIHTVERAILETDVDRLNRVVHCAEELWKDVDDGDSWKELSRSLLDLSQLFVKGKYSAILQRDPAKLIFAPFSPEDIVPLVKASLEDEHKESLSMAECTRMLLEDPRLASRLLRERITHYVDNGYSKVDPYDKKASSNSFVCETSLPIPNPQDSLTDRNTPEAYRLFEIVMAAISCLQLYMQENWTGPELTESEVNKFYPFDFCVDLWECTAEEKTDNINTTNGDSEKASGASDEDDKAIVNAILRRKTLVDKAALKGLEIDGLEMYEHVSYPLLLWGTNVIFESTFPSNLLNKKAETKAKPSWYIAEGLAFVEDDKKQSSHHPTSVHEIVGAGLSLLSPLWWRGRVSGIHQRSLVDKKPSGSLFIASLSCFRLTGTQICSEYAKAFSSEDRFQQDLVMDVLEQSHDVKNTDSASDISAECPIPSVSEYRKKQLQARMLLEWGIVQQSFRRQSAAKTSFFLSKTLSSLYTQLVGELGRRTKYQTHDISQLVLKARSTVPVENTVSNETKQASSTTAVNWTINPDSSNPLEKNPIGTKNSLGMQELKLDELDEENILYEQVQLAKDKGEDAIKENYDEQGNRKMPPWYNKEWGTERELPSTGESSTPAQLQPLALDGPVTPLDQGIILSLCLDIQNNNPRDGLVRDEMRAYVSRALETPQDWMTHSMGLLIKSWLEYESHWTVERGILQMQALVDQHTNRLTITQSSQKCIDESAPANERLAYIYSIAFPSRWELKRDLADRYRKGGVIRSALVLYEELELWNEIIECHVSLERLNRAKKLLRYRLSIHPTPRLWCLYGHVCNEDEYYLKAWELSGKRYAPAMLALGKRYYNRDEFEDARDALQKGLAISKQSESEWYLLGVVCMCLEDLRGAIDALSHCVQLTPDHADAWANLGSNFLKLEKYPQGLNALSEAVKHNPTNWKMQQNYLKAAMLNRRWSLAINSMHTLLELRWKDPHPKNTGIDIDSLGTLVMEVCSDLVSSDSSQTDCDSLDVNGRGQPESTVVDRSKDPGILPAPEEINLDDDEEDIDHDFHRVTKPDHGDGKRPRDYVESVAKLLGHITSAISKEPMVWSLYSRFNEVRGKHKEALECKKKQLRALQTAGWERGSNNKIHEVCTTANQLVAALISENTSAALMSARMLTKNILSQIDKAQNPVADRTETSEPSYIKELRQHLEYLQSPDQPAEQL
eukprot:gb/GECG01003799.1/.p1 GENE.gb/GECG01003799.1/~~gb/GECG01003799.1/.p1  ORF type:complete len:1221 (+),score=179.33 gb/GECG01003799.1/:1-3663(+)